MPMTADDVKRLRAELGLSQRQLAEELGVTAGYIALLEVGKRMASARVANRLTHLMESRLVSTGAGSSASRGEDDEPWSPDDDESPSDDSPFVVIVGSADSRRLVFVEKLLEDLRRATGSLLVTLDLASIRNDPMSLYQVLRERLIATVPKLAPILQLETQPNALKLLDILEKPAIPSLIISFDNWNPRGMGSHQAAADLGMLARKIRVIAVTEFLPPIVPGVGIVSVADDSNPDQPVVERLSSTITTSLEDIDKAVNDGRGRLPKSMVSLAEKLDQPSLRQRPAVWIALARELTRRAEPRDLERARVEIDNILQVDLGDGLRWHALLCATDLAIIEHEYRRAEDFISQLIDLNGRSAGAFDLGPVLVMKARALWEQSRFREALDALELADPRRDDDICRVANWKARTLLALGAIAPALRAAELGAKVAEDSNIRGGLAYSLTLAGQIEMFRGNLARSRRLMLRALSASSEALEMRVRPQILMQLAELDTFDGSPTDADSRIQEAAAVLADRPRRIWDSAYLTLARSRITRQRLNRDLICSMAHALTFEAGVVSARAPHHPVVGALHAEAAIAWVTAGYLHQASISAEKVDESRAYWLTGLELSQVTLFIDDTQTREEYLVQARDLVKTVLDAGAPYLATVTAYRLGAQVKSQWRAEAESLGKWTYEVAQARGWKRLARNARVLAPVPGSLEGPRGHLITNPDGSRTLIAPHRGQQRARAEIRPPLPDPFEDQEN
jgi:DNA-binding XRE family transcriptional regulator/tetratricopeptide (TPR) repeat protein